MKMKFIYVLLGALLLGSQMSLSAQNNDNREKKQRPTQEQLRECRMMNRKPRAEKAQGAEANAKREGQRPSMTDAEIAAMLKNQFAQSRKMLDIREKYYNEFSKILSQKQIMKIYQQEKSNANKFKKEFDRRKKGRKPGQGHHEGQKPRAPRQGEK